VKSYKGRSKRDAFDYKDCDDVSYSASDLSTHVRECPVKPAKVGVTPKMKPPVGSTVTRHEKPPSEHGVVTEVGKDNVTCAGI
jgi:hypothetical protein